MVSALRQSYPVASFGRGSLLASKRQTGSVIMTKRQLICDAANVKNHPTIENSLAREHHCYLPGTVSSVSRRHGQSIRNATVQSRDCPSTTSMTVARYSWANTERQRSILTKRNALCVCQHVLPQQLRLCCLLV
eukprot:scaffold530608_cov33-Prasinocladus_malaysianus.AAC.1